MRRISYSNVFDISHDLVDDEDLQPGDLVRTGPNLFPSYTVVAIAGDKVWVRDVQTAVDAITLVMRCRKINGPVAMRESGL